LAVRWDGQASQYRCGALMAPLEVLTEALPSWVAGATPWALRALARILPRLAQRWIAAGIGCDCSLETIKP
jgi:hypothetical protein